MKHDQDKAKRCERPIRLIQVGSTPPEKFMNVREMFEELAQREAEVIREARERAMKRIQADSTG